MLYLPNNIHRVYEHTPAKVYTFSLILCMLNKSFQLYPTLCNPMDWSPSGSSVPGILLEWLPCPPPGDLPNPGPGIKYASHMSPALAGRFFTTNNTWEAPSLMLRVVCLLASMTLWNYKLLEGKCCIICPWKLVIEALMGIWSWFLLWIELAISGK